MASLMVSQYMSRQPKYPPNLMSAFQSAQERLYCPLDPKIAAPYIECPPISVGIIIYIYIHYTVYSHEQPSNKAEENKFALILDVVDPKVGCSHRQYLPISSPITLHGATLMPSHKIFLPPPLEFFERTIYTTEYYRGESDEKSQCCLRCPRLSTTVVLNCQKYPFPWGHMLQGSQVSMCVF